MCTRVVYSGSNGMVATGRSMDWKTDMHSNLWVFPRGMKRNGETGDRIKESFWFVRFWRMPSDTVMLLLFNSITATAIPFK